MTSPPDAAAALAKSAEPLVDLIVQSDSPLVQVSVVDARFRRVAGGLGSCTTSQPPGLYKIKFDTGSKVDEQFVTLESNSPPVRIVAPPVAFASAAPLTKTSTTREYHREPAQRESRNVHKRCGPGATDSRIFLFVRDINGASPDGAGTGITLHDLDGKRLVDLTQDGVRGYQGDYTDPWAACNAEVAPGIYRLRSEWTRGRIFEQSVVASQGWQTQVFLLRRPIAKSATVRRANLLNTSIHMARLAVGFDPQNQYARSGELARQALSQERAVMSEGQMRDLLPQLLPEKFDNPMLGILGAHLLLLRSNPDLGLLDEVVRNLRILLPGHPDVEALALRLPAAQLTAATAFEFASPPMLFKSWSLVVASSVARAEIVPTGSLAARAAELLWGSGAWLVWRKPKDAVPKRAPTAASRDRRALEVVLGHVTDFVRESASHQSLRQLSQQWALSPVEVNVLGVLSRSLQQSQIMRTFALPEGTETITKVASGDTGEIVRALGVPTATLHATLESLARKLSV